MSRYPFSHLLEYIPKRFKATFQQEVDRRSVYQFKNGNCPIHLKQLLLQRIREVIASNPATWVVLFIPASSAPKTRTRYSQLIPYLTSQLKCQVWLDGINAVQNREAGHIAGKSMNPTENMCFNRHRFAGKNVILIDDVRTRGITFERTADRLMALGATSVYGVFLAQTVNPGYRIAQTVSNYDYDGPDFDDFEDYDVDVDDCYDPIDSDFDEPDYDDYEPDFDEY